MSERFLVTGALGCIGAWVCRLLIEEGVAVVAYDLGSDPHRLRLIMPPEQVAEVVLVRGDITDLTPLERALDEHEITNVVHLAALQVPFCRADPVLGAQVNVVGTVNVFEALKRRRDRIGTLANASSRAVFGPRGTFEPETLYGAYKLAGEGIARVYWRDESIPSISLRPYSVYGPGRDQGITSTPTQAMLAAVRGEPYRISFGGRVQHHYAPDVARAFIAASRTPSEGAAAHDLGGATSHMSEVVAAIEAAVPEAAGTITFDDVPLPFPEALESSFPFADTPLRDGVRETIELFRGAAPAA